MKTAWIIVATALLSFGQTTNKKEVPVATAPAEDLVGQSRESLKGLTGVRIFLSGIDAVMEKDGIDKAIIQTDIELELRRLGIPVLSWTEGEKMPGRPILGITVAAKPTPGSELQGDATGTAFLWTWIVKAELFQDVTLVRNAAAKVSAATWMVGRYGARVKGNFGQQREVVKDVVDEFANDYLSMNPKK